MRPYRDGYATLGIHFRGNIIIGKNNLRQAFRRIVFYQR